MAGCVMQRRRMGSWLPSSRLPAGGLMRRPILSVFSVVVLFGLITFLAPQTVLAEDPSATGIWTGPAQGGTLRGTVTLELRQNGSTVKGTYEALVGNTRQFFDVSGALEDRKVSLKMLNTAFGQLTGTISEDGKTMNGGGVGAS